jgi:hypothetical protein
MGHGVVNYVAFARLFQLNVDRSEGPASMLWKDRQCFLLSVRAGLRPRRLGATDDAAELQLEWIPCSLNLL